MKNIIKYTIMAFSLIAPLLYIFGPVLDKAGINFDLLGFLGLTVKYSYLLITISNGASLISALKEKNYLLSIVFVLWVIGMGWMFLLH